MSYGRFLNMMITRQHKFANKFHSNFSIFSTCRAKNQSEDGAGFLPSNPSSRARPSTAFRPAALPEYLEGRTPKEKHPFLFQKKSTPAKSEMQGVFFLSGFPPRLCEAVAGRFIRQDWFQKRFEFCTMNTANRDFASLKTEPSGGEAAARQRFEGGRSVKTKTICR